MGAGRGALIRAESEVILVYKSTAQQCALANNALMAVGVKFKTKSSSIFSFIKKFSAKEKIDYFSILARPCMHRRAAHQCAYFLSRFTDSFFMAAARRAKNPKTSEIVNFTKFARLRTKALSDYFAIFFHTNMRTQALYSNPDFQNCLQTTFRAPPRALTQRRFRRGSSGSSTWWLRAESRKGTPSGKGLSGEY
jgi:hypothetical protein